MVDLSVIIVSFNTKKLTLDSINSVLNEGSSIKREIIVVDNNSHDGSKEALRKVADTKKGVSLIENKDNVGFAKANNQAIKKAKGEYIFLLNSDTVVKKNSLKALIDFTKSKEDAGVVGARLLNKDGSIQESCVHFPTIKNALKEYFLGEKGLFNKYAPKGKSAQVVDALVGAAFLITPKALSEVGLLDERYFFYFEDIDYCRKVKKKGLKVYYFPKSEIYHYHGASGKKIADEENQWRRLVPSSKIYHGQVKHYLLTFILWLGQKWQKIKTT